MNAKYLMAGCFIFLLTVVRAQDYYNPVQGKVVVSNTWAVNGGLYIGEDTSSNTLNIVSGGFVQNTTGFIGFDAKGNQVVVDGGRWENSSRLYVGVIGGGNSMQVEGGGWVEAQDAFVGYIGSSSTNRVEVSDGSTLTIQNQLILGTKGHGNSLWISEGDVSAQSVVLGRDSTSFENSVYIDDGSFSTLSDLILGGSGSNNTISVHHSGLVEVGENLVIGQSVSGTYNRFSVSGIDSEAYADSIVVGQAGQYNYLDVKEAALLSAADTLVIGADEAARNNQVRLRDESSSLDAGDILIGDEGRYNQLRIQSGSAAHAASDAYIGFGSNAVGNLVLLDGEGSSFTVGEELYVGVHGAHNRLLVRNGAILESDEALIGSSPHARYNSAQISSGSAWTNRNHLSLANRSTLIIGSGARVTAGSYAQDSTSRLVYGFDPNSDATGVGLLTVHQNAVFDDGALIDFQAPLSQLEIGQNYTLLTAQQIIGGGLTNDVSRILPKQLLLDVSVMQTNGSASLQYVRKSLVEATGSSGLELEQILHSIDHLAQSNSQAEVMLQAVNAGKVGQGHVAEKLEQLYGRRVEVLNVMEQARVTAIGQVSARMRTVQNDQYHYLTGPNGPHKAGQGWAPWMKAYGSKGSADAQLQFSGYDAQTVGGVFGVDRSVGALLGGVAAGYSRSSVDQDDGDSSDVDTYYGTIYGSAGVRRWYSDFSFSYGRSSISARSGAGLGTYADYDASDYTGYVAVGRQARNRQWLVTPQVALTASYYMQESYTESSMFAVPTEVDSFNRWSVRGSLGAALAYEMVYDRLIVKPDVHAYWVHEFNAEEEEIGYRLIGGSGSYTYQVRSPDEDTLELGIGVELLFADRLKMTFDLDMEHGDSYEGFSASGRISYEF